ncbi:MAG TPA: glycosyltransferase family 4 protein [Candidatus Nanoarchaeia archaeon]
MRILLIYQYFRPEVGAGIERVFYPTKHLVGKGHQVTVITGIPNYPTGRIYPGYKLKFLHKEVLEGKINLLRTFVYPTKYTSTLKRLLNYLSFALSAFLVGLSQRNIDVIIASSPPLSSAVVGWLLSLIKKKPLIFEAQDVWPGAAVELGVLRNKLVIKIARFIEKEVYKRSEFVVAPTEETAQLLLKDNRFLDKEKVVSVLNSVDLKLFDAQKIDKPLVKKYKLEGKFVVLYSGTLGLQQGVDTLVECAKKLKRHKDIMFLIVGEGVDKDYIKKSKEKYKLNNMILVDPVEYGCIPSFVYACDAGLALLKKNRYQDAAFACKVFDYFAGRKPAIVSGGEAMRKIVEGSKAGFWVEAEDAQLLSEKILEASKMPKEILLKLGKQGRKLVERKYNREVQVRGWDKILEPINKGKS